MAITIERIEHDPVLLYKFSGRITLGDLEALRAQEAPYFNTLQPDECLQIMLDLSELYTIPAELFAPLQHTRLVRDQRVCVVSVVGANAYLRALAISLGLLAARHDFVFYATREEALSALEEHTATSRA